MNADVLTTKVTDGIALITLGSPKRIYFDAEMGDALTEALEGFAGDANVRVVVITGGAPGYFNRHFHIPALIEIAESLRASGGQWPENATYKGGFFDKAMALCESMPKPVIAAISGTALAGAFEFALACDLRHRGRRRIPDRITGSRAWSSSRRRWHSKAAAHHRNASRSHAYSHGKGAQSA